MKQHQVNIDTGKCIGCGRCAKVCCAHNIVVKQKKAKTVSDDCILCGHCSAVCPTKAVTISGYDTVQHEKQGDVRLNPDQVIDVIRFRRTIRNFKQTPIPKEVLRQLLEAGRLTHTAKNMQDVSFVVLDQEKNRAEQMAVRLFKRIKPVADLFMPMARNREIDDHFFFFRAPLVIVIFAKNPTNGILAAQNMEFVAEANSLGVLFSGFFTTAVNASRRLRKLLRAPKGKRAAMTLVLGYPDIAYLRSAPRKQLDVTYR